MQARPFAAAHMALSLSLYQVTVLRVLHGICTHVAWLVENIKLSRIVCINGLCQARDYLVRTLSQFVDVLRSLGMLAHPQVLPGVFLPSPRMGSTLARVSCPGIAPEWSAYCSLSPLSRTLDGRGIEAFQGPLGQDL